MKRPTASGPEGLTEATRATAGAEPGGKIHPVVIYPFKPPEGYADLEGLYKLVATLDAAKDRYHRPITVVDRKTHASLEHDKHYLDFRKDMVARHSDILDAWCVDTCQMWYSGLGAAFERSKAEDIFWLIPGDFNYGSAAGKEVLSRLHDLPEICLELGQDICIGEIETDHSH